MAPIEPPKLAAWMLGNLIPASERDEALAGDLEEHFRAGRCDGWYWRQAAAAVSVGWAQYLGRRRAMLVFALLWSILAPAWYVIANDFEASHDFDKVWEILGPLMLVAWTALHAAFLWAGLMVYRLVHTFVGKPIPRKEIRRAFWIVPLVLPPVYFITLVLTAIYGESASSLQHAKLATTLLGQVADVSVLANLIRIPYFITLTVALWKTTPSLRMTAASADALQQSWASLANRASRHLDRFFAFVVAAGVINALLCGFLLCRLPASNAPTLFSLLLRATIYVAIGAASGAAGAWIYWNFPDSPFRDSAPVDFRHFALVCAAGWIWAPAFILFFEQVTPVVAFVAAFGAFALAAGLRTVPLEFQPAHPPGFRQDNLADDIFADLFLRPQFDGAGIVIALAIYGGGYAIAQGCFMTASLLLGLAAFLLGWMRTVQRRQLASHPYARVVIRLAIFVVPAILVTAWALLDGVQSRNRMAAVKAAEATNGMQNGQRNAAARSSAHGFGGYESVILWPFPEKKQIVAPLPLQHGPLAPGTKRPLVIQFDGPYWFIQPPDERPGPHAHQAHGSPLGVRIMANNSDPLVMIARQPLGQPIPLARCGQIDVELDNRDQNLGVVAVVLLLEDSSSKSLPQLDVGRQQIVTGEAESSGLQSFRFRLPARTSLRRFDTVAIMFLPESGHERIAPRFAVRELRFYPR